MGYMDFHCHLDMKDFEERRREVVEEYFSAGNERLVTVADPYETTSFDITREILSYDYRVYAMAAAHPHKADSYDSKIEKSIVDFAGDNRVVAVGEAGLDFYYNLSTQENQLKVFRRQIALAKELGLPLVIHSRQAETRVLKTLEEEKFDGKVVFHCYTGSVEDAEEIVKRGYGISISGIVTFKKAESLRDVARQVPLDHLFTETDSPYLAPVPFRGKTNSPLYVRYVAEKIAELKEVPVEDINTAVNSNFERFFC